MSVACCLATAALAMRLPEDRAAGTEAEPAQGHPGSDTDSERGYFAFLRSGLAEATRRPAVGTAVVAVALLGGLDGLEEYFPLLAREWGVATSVVPLALLTIPLAGALGAALAGSTRQLPPRTLAVMFAAAVIIVGGAGLVRQPVGVGGSLWPTASTNWSWW